MTDYSPQTPSIMRGSQLDRRKFLWSAAAGLAVVGNDEIKEGIERILFLIRRDLGQPFALRAFEIAIYDGANQNSARSAAAEIDVLPRF